MKTIHPNGLKKLSKDTRDLRFGGLFKLPRVEDLPDEFIVEVPLEIKDQKNSDYCTCFAGCAVSEDQEGVKLDPLYQFFKVKQKEGDPNSWGADLRQAAQSFVDVGSIEENISPCDINTPRDKVLDPATWKDKDYDAIASDHKKASYAFISGGNDFFDNIRCTLWYFRDDKRSALMGTEWCAEWLYAVGGLIDALGTPVAGHAVKGMGWAQKNGQPHLVLQLSSGMDVGDGGIFYLSREVVNAQEPYGAVIFTDIAKEVLQAHQDYGVRVDLNPLAKMCVFLWLLIKEGFNFVKNHHG